MQLTELPAEHHHSGWLCGGFPKSLLAHSDAQSLNWRNHLISTDLERELPSYGARLPAQTWRRLWTMLAHGQGGLVDVSQLAKGLVIETLLNAAPRQSQAGFYRSSNGAEIDLVIDIPGQGLMAMEVKRSPNGKPRRGFYSACEDLMPRYRLLVHGGADVEAYPVGHGVTAIGLQALLQQWSQERPGQL